MLLCRDDGLIYLKVGISDHPTRRFWELRAGCGVTPRRYAFVEFRDRPKALAVEADLLEAFKDWRTHGEWFKLPCEEKPLFNERWQKVFAAHYDRNWRPLRWEQMATKKLTDLAKQKSNWWKKQFRYHGQAYRDFIAVSR
jgi:hypothetical protein